MCITSSLSQQIWSSVDGGRTFQVFFSLPPGETVTKFALGSQALAFLTNTGRVFYGRPGSARVAQLDGLLVPPNSTELVFDSTGILNTLITSDQACLVISSCSLLSSSTLVVPVQLMKPA